MKLFCKVTCAILVLVSVFGAFIEVKSINDVKDCKAYWEEVGEESTANLNKLEDGINTLSENHDAYIDGKAQLAQGEIDYAAGVDKLAAGRKELAAGIAQYNSGKKTLAATESAFGGKGCPVLKKAYDGVNELEAGYSNSKAYQTVADMGGSDYNKVKTIFENISEAINKGMSKEQAIEAVAKASISAEISAKEQTIVQDVTAEVRSEASEEINAEVERNRDKIEADIRNEHSASLEAQYREDHPEAGDDEVDNHVNSVIDDKTDATVSQQKTAALNSFMESEDAQSTINSTVKAQKNDMMDQMLAERKAQFGAVYSGVLNLINQHSHEEAVAMAASANGIPIEQMHQAYNGYVQYSQGAAKLNSASGELAAGKAKLAAGEDELVAGNLKLMDGRKQLKEFESGRQQVADGLDTAISTKPEGDIESIKSRLGENFDYIAEDGENLNYEKAMSVVEAARAYQDDSTVAVTEELTGRVVGAVAGLAAALFGIIASILTLLGLRRTGFATACLSAVAAAVCAFKVGAAGTVMSAAAGSQTGSMPLVIAVLCAAVAMAVAVSGILKKAN